MKKLPLLLMIIVVVLISLSVAFADDKPMVWDGNHFRLINLGTDGFWFSIRINNQDIEFGGWERGETQKYQVPCYDPDTKPKDSMDAVLREVMNCWFTTSGYYAPSNLYLGAEKVEFIHARRLDDFTVIVSMKTNINSYVMKPKPRDSENEVYEVRGL